MTPIREQYTAVTSAARFFLRPRKLTAEESEAMISALYDAAHTLDEIKNLVEKLQEKKDK